MCPAAYTGPKSNGVGEGQNGQLPEDSKVHFNSIIINQLHYNIALE